MFQQRLVNLRQPPENRRVGDQAPAHLHERPHHKDAHCHGFGTVQNRYSRDKRPDGRQGGIAVVLNAEGFPLADGRELVMPRYTQPEAEHRLVLEKLGWELPPQPPPRIRRAQVPTPPKDPETNLKM
jgi:hypothetical protein